ncbi:hypothetical protein RB195_002944 [Necator americanus]|uniref:Uncharacterized protein n=1 Tax=Necator americanus TaxID=51031 RepID=A0ABR1DLC8_NECAM
MRRGHLVERIRLHAYNGASHDTLKDRTFMRALVGCNAVGKKFRCDSTIDRWFETALVPPELFIAPNTDFIHRLITTSHCVGWTRVREAQKILY